MAKKSKSDYKYLKPKEPKPVTKAEKKMKKYRKLVSDE